MQIKDRFQRVPLSNVSIDENKIRQIVACDVLSPIVEFLNKFCVINTYRAFNCFKGRHFVKKY